MHKIYWTRGRTTIGHICMVDSENFGINEWVTFRIFFEFFWKHSKAVRCRGIEDVVLSKCVIGRIVDSECFVRKYSIAMNLYLVDIFLFKIRTIRATQDAAEQMPLELRNKKLRDLSGHERTILVQLLTRIASSCCWLFAHRVTLAIMSSERSVRPIAYPDPSRSE